MARIPMTAREQLAAAQELGHELSMVTREFPDYDVPPKFYVSCSCGWAGTAKRTRTAANGAMIWHLGKVLGQADVDAADRRRNGLAG